MGEEGRGRMAGIPEDPSQRMDTRGCYKRGWRYKAWSRIIQKETAKDGGGVAGERGENRG